MGALPTLSQLSPSFIEWVSIENKNSWALEVDNHDHVSLIEGYWRCINFNCNSSLLPLWIFWLPNPHH